ncbi:MAG: hypothetical protein ACREIG_05820, partial [Nitrospiraceae bacterium]
HHSDTEYEILGHNIGLTIKTVHNWDFVNPNNEDAHGLRIKLLSKSTASSLIIDWFYAFSPWTSPANPVKIGPATTPFQGDPDYNVFQLDFTTAQSWSGVTPGVVPPGVGFHVGATFAEPGPVIVYETKLLRSNGSELPLSPRLIGYDAGSFNPTSGNFVLTFFNPAPAEGPLELRNLRIHHFPRLVDINTMIEGAKPLGLHGLPVEDVRREISKFPPMKVVDQVSVRIASLTDKRNVDITYDAIDCKRGISPVGHPEYCPEGTALSLFPSTIVYVTATVVDPNAKFWDPGAGQFVQGPLETKLFYQFAGIVPDLNNNGVDDLLDIRTGVSLDENNNGVPDEVEPSGKPLTFEYAPKIVCGLQEDQNDMRLARGFYATAISIHNPNHSEVKLSKKLALTFPPEEQRPGKMMPLGKDILRPDQALEVDCMDIRRELFPHGFPTPYITGVVVIRSSASLDVTAVYTAAKPGGFLSSRKVTSIDVEQIREREVKREGPGRR